MLLLRRSPAGEEAKYCDEHVCVCLCVCLSTRMSPEPHARSLPIFLCILPMAVARFSSPPVGEGTVLGVFYPIDNALYSIVFIFRTHTKTVEPIEMSFGMMTRVGRRPWVRWGPDPQGEGAIFFGGGDVAAHRKVMMNGELYKKRLNRSTCRFGWRLRWAKVTMY